MEVHLEGGYDMGGCLSGQPIDRNVIAVGRKLCLQLRDIALPWRMLPVIGNRVFVVPGAHAIVAIKPFPGKERSGIGFAAGGEVRMPDDPLRPDAMPLDDIACKLAQRVDLCRWIGVPLPLHQGHVFLVGRKPQVHDFDADTRRVEQAATLPETDPGMPRATRLGNQLVNAMGTIGLGTLGHEVMGTDLHRRRGKHLE